MCKEMQIKVEYLNINAKIKNKHTYLDMKI